MEWPGNAPDTNPIEKVWPWMKNEIQERQKKSQIKGTNVEFFKGIIFFLKKCKTLCKK